MDLQAVRTFVAAVDIGQFQDAAAALGVTQQAVSKRVAALERDLHVVLFTRTPRGVRLTVDGQAFLPHARELLRVADRADASVRPGRRALRVDVHSRRIAPAGVLQEFHRQHPDVDLDVVTMLDANVNAAAEAVAAGTIDATFHAVRGALAPPLTAARVIDDAHQLLVGPDHPLAFAGSVSVSELAGHRLWMPGLAPETEWTDYYDELAAAFGLTIDVAGPVFGYEAQLAEIAATAQLATLVGEGSRYLWPDSFGLRRIPIRNPTPIYPMSLIWRADNPHPGLALLRDHLASGRGDRRSEDVWMPSWVDRIG
ncbi:LysR family transcriptional regulator [Cryptosporangium phraense]|uniref:LysR family transcriptional regulator n=1 Tax=Cryptosporangium phraense TaxID=2593070 RepID=A0A545B232_9ACTN|nr:LysR family transcriptional regulator [Cryptosporangium phraense]TQS46905.1 LysR family transcriptional regulator [Cryptosporangium phraense]